MQLSGITWCILSDYVQLPLTPQKALNYLFHMQSHSSRPENTLLCAEMEELLFKYIHFHKNTF